MSNRGFAAICLVNPKTHHNVGGVLRAAGCYSADLLVVAGNRGRLSLRTCATDPQKAWRHMPTIEVADSDPFGAHPVGSIPVAVDLVPGAVSLPDFAHPERAYYIFGPEDGTLGKAVTDRCKYKVMIPTAYCMNLAACVNVVLYDRMAKALAKSRTREAA